MPYRKTYRKKPVYKRKRKTVPKKRVYNKKDIRTIAKNVLMKEAESKYFSTASLFSLSGTANSGLEFGLVRTGYSQMRTIGFAAGSAAQVGGGGVLNYGLDPTSGNPRAIYALQHGRVFASNDANGYDMEGSYVSPMLNITTFNLQRLFLNTTTESEAVNATPYFVRVLRIVPRPIKSSRSEMDPQADAFLDQYSQQIGVSNANFTQYELQMLKPNTKKYKVLQDLSFTMRPSATWNALDIGTGTQQVSTLNTDCRRQMTFKHNIGKKLFYEQPTLASNPTDGFENEFILFHVIPLGTANVAAYSPNALRIAAKPVGTFKDI